MKKCTSCAKDLPDSALHCVFCGAKQAPAPVPGAAAQQAKTVLGYQAGDVVKELQRQGVSVPRPGGGSSPPMGNPPMGTAPTLARPGGPGGPAGAMPPPPGPMPNYPPPPPSYPPPPGPMPPAGAVAPSQAKTVFIAGGQGPGAPAPAQPPPNNMPMMGGGFPPPPNYPPPPPPQGAPMPMGNPGSAPVVMPNYQAPSAPVVMPNYQAPSAPVAMPMPHAPSGPAAAPPYLASQTALRASRPVEPFNDGLKLVLLSFGILLLGAFATPLSTDPMVFHWNAIIDAPGVAKLYGLMLVATGVLALVIALMPLAAIPRGAIAAGIGVFIILTPIIQAGALGPWQELVQTLALLTLVGGLLVRHEYREAMLGRILTTIGAVTVLALFLIPTGGGDPPLVGMFKAIIDAPLAEQKIAALVLLLPAVLAIVSLLCWLPAPSSAGAKALAWTWIVYPAVVIVGIGILRTGGDVGKWIKASPFTALMSWVPAAAAAAFAGYGVATIAGKSLE